LPVGFHFIKARIADIVNGEFVKNDAGEFLRAKNGKELSRIRILGRIVEKFVSNDGNYAALTLDDGTETMRAKFFQQSVSGITNVIAGDLIDIFGFVREYEGEVYIAPLIMKKISDSNYETLRKLELAVDASVKGGEEISEIDMESAVLLKVSELDSGSGVKIETLSNSLSIEEDRTIELIRNLLIKGDLYEPKKGFVKRID